MEFREADILEEFKIAHNLTTLSAINSFIDDILEDPNNLQLSVSDILKTIFIAHDYYSTEVDESVEGLPFLQKIEQLTLTLNFRDVLIECMFGCSGDEDAYYCSVTSVLFTFSMELMDWEEVFDYEVSTGVTHQSYAEVLSTTSLIYLHNITHRIRELYLLVRELTFYDPDRDDELPVPFHINVLSLAPNVVVCKEFTLNLVQMCCLRDTRESEIISWITALIVMMSLRILKVNLI